MNILVFNVGSTTLKFALINRESGDRIATGLIDRIGQPDGDAPDHMTAARNVLTQLSGQSVDAIGHRIVHGGVLFEKPTRVTPEVMKSLAALDRLAPLHNPPARLVVESLIDGDIPQSLVFDTAWFGTLPESAWRYALPQSLLADHGVRRYGFHGTSHKYVTDQAIQHLNDKHSDSVSDSPKIISLHLGGGASAAASIGGVAVDTSMGMTPLEGLMMATRCGDIDPAIPVFLMNATGMSAADVDRTLNRESGLTGICGDSDMRTVLQRSADGDAAATLAVDMYVRKIVKTVGSYLAILGGLDALVFTAGVGEHSVEIRSRVAVALNHLGIVIDAAANERCERPVACIGSGPVKVLVIATDEELAIARQVEV